MNQNLSEHPTGGENFPDTSVPSDANCFGYVFYKLGMDPFVGTNEFAGESASKWFVRVESQQQANAIGFYQPGIKDYHHMAYIDDDRGRKIFHKLNVGLPVEETTLDELKATYPRCEVVFLRRTEKPKILTYLKKLVMTGSRH